METKKSFNYEYIRTWINSKPKDIESGILFDSHALKLST